MRYYDRMEKKVTDAMLFRFFAEQTTLEETDMISAWLNEDPEKNQFSIKHIICMYWA